MERGASNWDIREVAPPPAGEGFFHGKPPRLWGLGDPALLNYPLVGIIAARQNDSDLASKTAQLLAKLASLKHVGFVSGWHSPLEQEALRILLAEEARIILCIAKSLDRFTPSIGIETRIIEGKALVLTHCGPKAKRITRNASLRRNELIVELAKSVLVLAAPECSASLNLAKSALRGGKFVLTPEHSMNKELLSSGALPATLANLKLSLR